MKFWLKTENIKIINPTQKFSKLPLIIPIQTLKTSATTLKANLTFYYCREDNTGVCLLKRLTWRIPVNVVAGKKASNKIEVSANVN
ncbi:MAG: hypothetical protein LC768_14130 [Acidobacteria bacterium]|nr:hypothetical protein [Acidobacteriota bacterium]